MNKIIFLLVISSLFFICRKNGDNNGSDYKFDFDIEKGKSFQIELKSNPTTGYSWKWINRTSVSIVDTAGYKYLPDRPGLVGSGGKEIWTFKGMSIGNDSLRFEYNRSWEPNSTVESKTIYVRVK
ncbi:MAG: protease inhibitor I42 family protein [Ignavibacteria bacterium]|nr:protease inhibitor I42 family protein [Ignavibacteria bacterium]